MKTITILGSTGSIGTQTLDIIRNNPDKYKIVGLSCKHNIQKLKEQIEEFKPEAVAVDTIEQAQELQKLYPKMNIEVGEQGLKNIAADVNSDMLLNSLVGISGLTPTYEAIKSGKDIALANKETLVAGGSIIMQEVKKYGANLLPVDSEHSAIFQSLMGNNKKDVNKLILTASGGPFRNKKIDELQDVTLEQALNHPNWSMGSKITIDSATLMNKGLEVIEACHLFDVEVDDIEVVVHPQSIVHSGVEYVDGSIIVQMGMPDMKIPISLALTYPNRLYMTDSRLDIFDMANLTFEKPDEGTFKCLHLAKQAMKQGGSYPVVLNAANEVLVEKFLCGQIKFLDIQNGIENILNKHVPTYDMQLGDVMRIDREIRKDICGKGEIK